jgi:hypothetical protein
MKTKLFISGLVFMALTTFAGAQSKDGSSPMPQGGAGKGVFVDANKDGICDNLGKNCGNGSNCMRSGANNGCGMGGRQMQGMGKGMGQGKGQGKDFVDADKNGICDNCEKAAKK